MPLVDFSAVTEELVLGITRLKVVGSFFVNGVSRLNLLVKDEQIGTTMKDNVLKGQVGVRVTDSVSLKRKITLGLAEILQLDLEDCLSLDNFVFNKLIFTVNVLFLGLTGDR